MKPEIHLLRAALGMIPLARTGRTYSGVWTNRQAEAGHRCLHALVPGKHIGSLLSPPGERFALVRAFQGAGRRAGCGDTVLALLAGRHALIHCFRVVGGEIQSNAFVD